MSQVLLHIRGVLTISGRGGSKITEIRRLSGSRISIAKVPHDDTGERMFTIVGTPESTERALMLLYSQLESEKERREYRNMPGALSRGRLMYQVSIKVERPRWTSNSLHALFFSSASTIRPSPSNSLFAFLHAGCRDDLARLW